MSFDLTTRSQLSLEIADCKALVREETASLVALVKVLNHASRTLLHTNLKKSRTEKKLVTEHA